MQQMDRDRDREKKGESSPRPNSLLDKQLEDILRTAERAHRRQLFWRRVRGVGSVVAGSATRRRGLTSGRLMAWGLGLCVIAVLIGRAVPGLTALLLLAGVILFISPVFLSFGRGGAGGARDERLWRGRVIEYPRNDLLAGGRRWVQRAVRRLRGNGPRPGS
jgi:hypothetical protein